MADILHFRGDHTNFDASHVMGPDLFGAHYSPVDATYDAAADMTTMELRVINNRR
ncbi:Uncharacterised protein [Mycobacteroides abscessus subsp. abscessus]|nr:Uncharacterised protein [Mycobacteroides abscessus subsp. abscessus]